MSEPTLPEMTIPNEEETEALEAEEERVEPKEEAEEEPEPKPKRKSRRRKARKPAPPPPITLQQFLRNCRSERKVHPYILYAFEREERGGDRQIDTEQGYRDRLEQFRTRTTR